MLLYNSFLQVWWIKGGYEFFVSPPVKRCGLCPIPLRIWMGSRTTLTNRIQQKGCCACFQGQALRDKISTCLWEHLLWEL